MVNIPNPVELLLNRLKRYKAKPPPDAPEGKTGPKSCAGVSG
jgi:hypothetical protein